jgi:hypothetical protein
MGRLGGGEAEPRCNPLTYYPGSNTKCIRSQLKEHQCRFSTLARHFSGRGQQSTIVPSM